MGCTRLGAYIDFLSRFIARVSPPLRKWRWNDIWKLQVPNKVCHFIWRAIRESLPIKLNLHKRQVVTDGLCELCRDCPSRAISFSKDLSIHQMVVEGDSLWVIKAINDARLVRTMYGHVINDTRILSSIICCSFLDVKPKSNRLAHVLTHRAVVSVNIDMWLEDLSRDLVDVFQFDFL